MERIITHLYLSPCGELLLGSYGGRLCLCDWHTAPHRHRVAARLRRLLCAEFEEGHSTIIEITAAQLDEYFAMKRRDFDIPLLTAGTAFQKTVWNRLAGIAYGSTVSYGDFAADIGFPKATRAIANACGANAISIILPCHRVTGRNGSLTGYAGGYDAKSYLLELEKAFSQGVTDRP
ncbi:MAG: methylated-DNA--[protein]-cysteine S-methyltransferase [Muribaculaceae bacterium]|nr:methylated-DNA--[protein]-cysteine S-methyltransferase [Muribaculaceae bacterium]